MRITFAMYFGACALLTGCGGDDAADTVDATLADAPPTADARIDATTCSGSSMLCDGLCVDTTQNPDHCGGCGIECTPAAGCEASDCACPAPFLTANAPVLGAQMVATQPGYLAGGVGVTGTDGYAHVVLVTVEDDVATGTAIPVNTSVYVGIGYDLQTPTEARSTYLATAGTVRVNRRCATGLGGVAQNLSLVEIDPTTFQPLPGGCTTTLASFPFSIGTSCP